MQRIDCCYQCPDRHLGCHDACQKYIDQKEARKSEKEFINKRRLEEYGFKRKKKKGKN